MMVRAYSAAGASAAGASTVGSSAPHPPHLPSANSTPPHCAHFFWSSIDTNRPLRNSTFLESHASTQRTGHENEIHEHSITLLPRPQCAPIDLPKQCSWTPCQIPLKSSPTACEYLFLRSIWYCQKYSHR